MKVALLLSGQPRFIDDHRPFLFFKENIIDVYDVDVYCHAWFNNDNRYQVSPWSKNAHKLESFSQLTKKNPVPDNADEIILKSYQPKKYKFDSPREFEFNSESQIILDKKFTGRHPEGFWSKIGYSCILSQVKSMQECLKLVNIDNYDVIILSRYDVTVDNFSSIKLESLDMEYMHLQNIHDRFPDGVYIFGKKYYEWFLNLFDEIQTKKIVEKIPHPSTEQFKRTSFDMNFGMKNIKSHPIRINILRK